MRLRSHLARRLVGAVDLLTLVGTIGALGCATTPSGDPSPTTVLEIVGPGVPRSVLGGPSSYFVAPGETVRFRALEKSANRSARDVTNEVEWRSDNFNVSVVAGLVTGQQVGPGTLRVHRSGTGVGTHAGVIVIPPSTYVVGGRVSESTDPLVDVDAPLVLVTSGLAQGQSTVAFGSYRLYGLAGQTTLRVTRDGYQTQEQTIDVTDHQRLDIELQLLAPRPDVSGQYTWTMTAAGTCEGLRTEGTLPEEAKQRRYTASVTQRGPELSVKVSGADFMAPMPADRVVRGRIESGRVMFYLWWGDAWWDFGPPQIVERLSTGETLVLDGSAQATISERRMAGVFDGGFYVYPRGVSPAVGTAPAASCSSSRHQFVMSR